MRRITYTFIVVLAGALFAVFFVLTFRNCEVKPIHHGPFTAGRGSGILAASSSPGHLFICSFGGGVFKTLNNGKNWQALGSLPDPNVSLIEWDSDNPTVLLASTPTNLFKCINPYSSDPVWEPYAEGIPAIFPAASKSLIKHEFPGRLCQMDIPGHGHYVFFSRLGEGVYVSFNGGRFVNYRIPDFSGNHLNEIVHMCPDKWSNTLMVAISTDSNAQRVWRIGPFGSANIPPQIIPIGTGLPPGSQIQDITVNENYRRMSILLYAGGSPGIYHFKYDELNWQSEPVTLPDLNEYRTLRYGLGVNDLFVGASAGLYRIGTSGTTWQLIPYYNEDLRYHADINDFELKSYPGNRDYSLFLITDGERRDLSGGITDCNIMRYNYRPGEGMPTNPFPVATDSLNNWTAQTVWAGYTRDGKWRVFTGGVDNGSQCLENSRWNFTNVTPFAGAGDVWSFVAAPSDNNVVYCREYNPVLWKTSQALVTGSIAFGNWQVITEPDQELYSPFVVMPGMTSVHPSDPDKVVFAERNSVSFTSNGGRHLNKTSIIVNTGSETVTALPVTVHYALDKVLCGTLRHGLFITTNQGASWQPFGLNTNEARQVVLDIALTKRNQIETWYAATTKGLFVKSGTGGWRQLRLQPFIENEIVSAVTVDPLCPGRVAVGTGYGDRFGRQPGRVLISKNYGDSWELFSSHGGAPVTDLFFPPAGNSRALWAATYGGGVKSFDLPVNSCD